jgi:hypothetical protein
MTTMLRNAATPRKPPGVRRLGAVEVLRRERAIEEMLALGMNREQVLAACSREFEMPSRTVDDYVERIRKAWAEEAARTRPERREAGRARLLLLREDLKRWKQGGPLVALERLLCDIDGTKEPEAVRIEADVKATPLETEMSEEAIAEEMAELVACIPAFLRAETLAPSDELRAVVLQLGRELGLRMAPASNGFALGAPVA